MRKNPVAMVFGIILIIASPIMLFCGLILSFLFYARPVGIGLMIGGGVAVGVGIALAVYGSPHVMSRLQCPLCDAQILIYTPKHLEVLQKNDAEMELKCVECGKETTISATDISLI